MALPYKQPQNYRASPVRVGTPEGISISGGLALLSEAPADPTNPATPVVVVVNGTSRTRVTGTPSAGQYRIRTQTVIAANGTARTEYLPVLEFHSSDEGLTGTCDFYLTGTIITAEWFDALAALLTPLVNVATAAALQTDYPASTSLTAQGRPGRIAFLADGSMYFSDGVQWRVVAANVSPNNWSEAMGLTPRLGISSVPAFTAAWTALETIAASLGFASTESYLASGVAGALGLSSVLDLAAASSFAASWADARSQAASLGFSGSESYSAGGATSVSDDFNRADGGLGSNWATITSEAPAIASNQVRRPTTGTTPRRAARWSANSFANNQEAEVEVSGSELPTHTGGGEGVGPIVRAASGADSYYFAALYCVEDGFGGWERYLQIGKRVAGTVTMLGTAYYIGYDPYPPIVRLRVSGTTLTAATASTHGGTYTDRCTVTDSDLSSGSAGVFLHCGSSETARVDNFYGADL